MWTNTPKLFWMVQILHHVAFVTDICSNLEVRKLGIFNVILDQGLFGVVHTLLQFCGILPIRGTRRVKFCHRGDYNFFGFYDPTYIFGLYTCILECGYGLAPCGTINFLRLQTQTGIFNVE